MQSLITAGWILIVNTVATAYNPKTHSRQSGVPTLTPSSSSYAVRLGYANTGEVMGIRRSNKYAHLPFQMGESKREIKCSRRQTKGTIITVIGGITNSPTMPKPYMNESSHSVIPTKLHPGDIFA